MNSEISDEEAEFLAELVEARTNEILGSDAPKDQLELVSGLLAVKLKLIIENVRREAYSEGEIDGNSKCD